MKLSIKFLAIIALFLTFNLTANAQRGGKSFNPEQMAEKQTTRMTEKLGLDETQTLKVQEINLVYAKKMQEAHESNKGNREAMKEIGTAIREEKNVEMQQVLTVEQFSAYEEMQAKQADRKGKKGRQRG